MFDVLTKPKEITSFVKRLAKLIKNKKVNELDDLNEEMIKKHGVSYSGSALITKGKPCSLARLVDSRTFCSAIS